MASKKQLPVTSEAKPVLAPSATPAVDSAKVLTVETPSTEPTFRTDSCKPERAASRGHGYDDYNSDTLKKALVYVLLPIAWAPFTETL